MSHSLYDKKRIKIIIAIMLALFVLLALYAIFIVHGRSQTQDESTQSTDRGDLSQMNMAQPLLDTLRRNSMSASSDYLVSDEKSDRDALESFERELLNDDLIINLQKNDSEPYADGKDRASSFAHNGASVSDANKSNVLLDELEINYDSQIISDPYALSDIQTEYQNESRVYEGSKADSAYKDGTSLHESRMQAFNEAVKSSSRLNISNSNGILGRQDKIYPQESTAYRENSAPNSYAPASYTDAAYPYANKDKRQGSVATLDSYNALKHDNYTLHSKVQSVTSPYLLRQGAVLPAILLTGINSQLPGQVSAQITRNVYDTPTGRYLLIPRGSKLIGQYNASPAMGAERVMLGFNRLIFPDGRALDLGAMPVSGNDGMAGLEADVNTHFMRLLTYSALLGTISASVSIAEGREYDENGKVKPSSALSEALTQSLGSALSESIRQNMSIAPTLEVGSGYPFNLTLTSDIYFDKSYKDYNY